MKLTVHDATGKEVDTIEVDDGVFGIAPNGPVVHQALVATRANRRLGNASTKTRGEVAGSTRKIRRQKGTGASRQGSIRAPHHRHGGIVFGPRSRSYAKTLPKRMRRLAIRSLLSAKAQDGSLRVVDQLPIASPSTKVMAGVLRALGFERSVLVVTGAADDAVKRSARNIEKVGTLPAAYLNVADLLQFQGLLMTVDAVRGAETLWGGEKAKTRRQKAEA
ncbi:MAG TPA: 50S ribosomal protein L4 [Dehalococcoidia bacterium]|jgi:large subunit ribosomal protein L4|nr:50S ribosomal protein L4 [Dehalococcoidia bacterium]